MPKQGEDREKYGYEIKKITSRRREETGDL
jgi:hypothetical protein